MTLPDPAHHAARIVALAGSHDHVLVEGASGLLVELHAQGHTGADLAAAATDADRAELSGLFACRGIGADPGGLQRRGRRPGAPFSPAFIDQPSIGPLL